MYEKEFSLWLKTISIYFLPDVMRSQDARILILEEEVKTSAAKETETIKARDQAVKEVQKINERCVLFNNMYESYWY